MTEPNGNSELCINCGKSLIAELVGFDLGKGVPLDYRTERYDWKCLNCGFIRHTFVNLHASGYYTGD